MRFAPLAAALALLILVFALSAPTSLGPGVFGAGFAAVLQIWIESGGVSLAWLLGALGLGRVVRPLLRVSPGSAANANAAPSGGWTLQLCAGVAIMLALSHGLGALGLFGGRGGMLIAWTPVVVGVLTLFDQIRRRENRPELWGAVPATALLGLPGAAILIVAACAPPGTLWSSEARGYDTLSYHLQLPREWLEQSRIAPIEHNVYSCLPSYVEAAFTHLAAMLAPGARALTDDVGRAVFAAQILHALIAIASAAALGRLVVLLTASRGDPPGLSRASIRAGGLAAAALLATPWVIVVGSMAYNGLVVVLMLIGALVAAREQACTPFARGLLVGGLMGAAVCAKLTASYMAVPVVALAMLLWIPRASWLIAFSAAAGAGLLYLAPFLVRNAIWLGNPVFPFATSLLGSAHWTSEQVARWNSAHHPPIGWLDRLALLVGAQRGALHPQWFIFFPAAIVAGALALRDRAVRSTSLFLLGALAMQVIAWLSFGHLQPRFLLPAAPIAAAMIGLAAASIMRTRAANSPETERSGWWRNKWIVLIACAIAALAGASTLNFLSQNSARPNIALATGVGAINGALAESAAVRMDGAERRDLLDSLSPPALINLAFDAPSSSTRLYLLGDATPFYFHPPLIYNTTWDTWPLAESLRRTDGDLAPAVADLRSQGVTHILVNLDEIARLHADGWADPLITPELAVRLVSEAGKVVWRWSVPGGAGAVLLDISGPESPDSMP